MSANVSRMLSHFDLPREIIQANGNPAIRSSAATIKPIVKEFDIAFHAVFINWGCSKMLWIVPAFIRMPIMGGTRMTAKKMMIAER